MTLPKLRPEQHAQILGFSVIGYGVSFIVTVAVPLINYWSAWNKATEKISGMDDHLRRDFKTITENPIDPLAVPMIIYALGMFAICCVTGLIVRNQFPDPKLFGLVFVILCFGFFPLGTLVSLYMLIYLFAIYEGEGAAVENSINLN